MATQNQPTKIQSTVPTTAGQIISMDNVQFKIYDQPVHIIYIVGVIRNIQIDGTDVALVIQDHTGVIQAEMHLETESELESRLSAIDENIYARVFGKVRAVHGTKKIQVLKIIQIDDLDLIVSHYLQVIAFTVHAESERKKQLASANSSGAALADSLFVTEEESVSAAPRVNALQKLIFDIIRSEFTEIGISRNNILRQFPAYQHGDIREAMDYLVREGLAYYSVDQEHLKTVEF